MIARNKSERLKIERRKKFPLVYMFEIHLLRFTSSISMDFGNEELLCGGDVRNNS